MRKRGRRKERLLKGSAAGLACAAVLMGVLSSAAPFSAVPVPGNPGTGDMGGGAGVESPGENPGPGDEPGFAPQDDREFQDEIKA